MRFGHWVEKKLAAGWQIQSCYEAGASGYWLHRQLEGLGVENLVMAPKAMGGDKRQKTDRRDSAELVDDPPVDRPANSEEHCAC
jgi:transposase